MKKKLLKSLGLLMLLSLTLFSCTTTDTNVETEDPNFLGNFDPFYLDEVMCLSETTFGNTKPISVYLYFVPRTNSVQAKFKDGMNNVLLVWTKEQRDVLMSSITKYGEAINGAEKMEVRKPTDKNAFDKGKVDIYWGVGGYTRNTVANYFTNYQYLEENKPYFLLRVKATPTTDEEYVSSPTVNLYFTPSQLEALIAAVDTDVIMEKLNEIEAKAYEW